MGDALAPAPRSSFARYWMAAALSSFGSAVTAVAMPVLVVQLLGAPLDTPQFSARCRKAARSTCIANTLCRNIATASSEKNFRDAPTWHIPTRRVLV